MAPAGSFEMKPLEMKDFSGGLTDNFLTAGPTHYQFADNFWIAVDKHLQERWGTVVADTTAYKLPTPNPQRPGGLFTYINETILLSQSARTIYYLQPGVAWQPILGPQSQETLGGGDIYSSVVSSEWNRHIFFASDAQIQPVKVYRDANNNYAVRTAGLPRALGQPNISQSGALGTAIIEANQLRQSFIAHMNDLTLHAAVDTSTVTTLSAVAPAQDLPTLLTLLNALTIAYEAQRFDASGFRESSVNHRVFHNEIESFTSGYSLSIFPRGMYVKLLNTIPITVNITVPQSLFPMTSQQYALLLAAAQADDIAQKWYWHRLALWTHDPINNYNNMNKYAITAQKVGLINIGQPVATGNLQDLFNFANNIKFYYNTHIADGGNINAAHMEPDGYDAFAPGDAPFGAQPWNISLPDCTDYDSMANLIFWERCLYQQHIQDVSNTFRTILFDTTANSTAVVNLNYANPFFAGVQVADFYKIYAPSTFKSGQIASQIVGSGGAGLATMKFQAIANGSQVKGQLTAALYHVAKDASGNQLDAYPPPIGTWVPNPNTTITSQVDSVGLDAVTWAALADEMYFVLNAHMDDQTVHNHANPMATVGDQIPYPPFFVPKVAQYSYAFTFSDEYTVEANGLQFRIESNPIYLTPIETTTIIPPGATVLSANPQAYPNATYQNLIPVQLTNLPSIVNTANTMYNTNNPVPSDPGLLLNIYRTTDGGTTWFLITSLPNGTLSYTDQTSDAVSYPNFPALNTQEPIYTTGGVVGNDQPPASVCMTVLDQYAYYGGIVDTGQFFPNRIRQSLQNNLDSAPATFFDDLEDQVVAMSSTRSVVVALCKSSIYRLNGNFNKLGQGLISHEKISDTMGCISAKSVVKTEIGVFFAGLDGFYYTDGYQLIKLTIDLNARYQNFTQSLNQQTRIQGCYDKLNRRIYWTVQESETDTNQNMIYAFYLDYGVKPEGVFTGAFKNFAYLRPSSIVFYQGNLWYGHELGYFLRTDELTKTDPIIDITKVPSQWQTVYIPYFFASPSLNFGSVFNRKWNTKVHYLGNQGDYTGANMAIQIVSIRDNKTQDQQNLPVLDYKENPRWGDPLYTWHPGDSVNPRPWNKTGKVDAWRRFPAGQLRCDTRQMIIKPAYLGIYKSDSWPAFSLATATWAPGDPTANVALATPAGYTLLTWPNDCPGYNIAFDDDGYVQEYPIVSVAAQNMTISVSPSTFVPNAGMKWVIRGFKKAQRVHLNSLIVYYDYLGDKNSQYLGRTSAGENA